MRDELEHCFGDGPPLEQTDLLARGRRSLRRRRLAEAGTALAAAVFVAGGAMAAARGHEPGAAPPPPLATASATPSPAPPSTPPSTTGVDFPPPPDAAPVQDDGLPEDWGVDLRPDGLHVAAGVTVLRVVDDPWHLREVGAWSAAVVYRDRGGTTLWYAGYVDAELGGEGSGIPAANADEPSFADWVDRQGATLLVHGRPPAEHQGSPGAGGRS